MRRSNGLPTSFLDLVFNIALGFVVLFILAFILINIKKQEDSGKIIPKAEYLIEMTWTADSCDDIDLWVRDPFGKIVNFKSPQSGIAHLDKDDLGCRTDTTSMPDGTIKIIKHNKEIVTLRGTVPGNYLVNVHFYNRYNEVPIDNEIIVTVSKLNPFKEIAKKDLVLSEVGQELTAMSFCIDSDGNSCGVDYLHEEKMIK